VAYVTAEMVRLVAQIDSLTADQSTLVAQAIGRAEKLFEHWTGTWWAKRTAVTVKTEASDALQRTLFMPAQISAITSITEDGVALAASDYVLYDSWIEKLGTPAFNEPAGAFSYWTLNQQGIVVLGDFGYAAVPDDVVGATAEVAAIIAGLKRRSYQQQDGVEATVILTAMPDWIRDVVISRKFEHAPNRWIISPDMP
jgi:hypothetical protein